jgi:hypothetical protein
MSDTHMHSSPSGRAEGGTPKNATIRVPPLTAHHPLLRSLPPLTHLPADLLDLLNQTYFLHLLSNDSSKLLPPGKSLLSVLSQPNIPERRDNEPPTLHDKVEEMIHKAFWDEVLHRLNLHFSLLITVFARHWVPSPPENLLPSFPVSSFYSMTYTPSSYRYSPRGIPFSLSYPLLLRLRLLLFIQHGITAVRFLSHSVSVAHQHATHILTPSLLRYPIHPLILLLSRRS